MARVGLTTARLVDSGAELADEAGFEVVTLSALARRHGVKVASLYSHVSNSHDLRSRICLQALEELADRGAAALAGRAGPEALVALAGVYRTYAHEHPGRYAAAEYRLDAVDAAAGAGPRHAELARAVLHGYDLDEPEQTHAVRLLGSVIRGFVNLELAGGFSHSEPDADQSWSWCLDALDALLRRRADPRPPAPTTPERSTP